MLIFMFFRFSCAIHIIAVNEEPPFSMCSIPFSGYEVDLVQSALSVYGWRYNEDYTFACFSENLNFSAKIGRVQMTAYSYSIDYSYSYPTYNLQLGILAYSNLYVSTSKFINIFSPELWLMIPCYSLGIALILLVFEMNPNSNLREWIKNLRIVTWVTFSSNFFAEQKYNYRVTSRLIVIGYLFFNLLIFLLYLAGCMVLTFENVKLIDFPEKLQNTRYTTYKTYLDYTSTYGGFFVDVGIDSSNIEHKLSKLDNQDLDAIVMEYETITSIARENCDYVVTSKPFNSIFYAVEIMPGVDPELKTAIDFGITQLVRQFDMETLKSAYFYKGNNCNSQLHHVAPVGMYQLIYLFGGYAGFAFLIFLMRELCTTRELVKERNKVVEGIRKIISRPESKITKLTMNQIRQQDSQFSFHLEELGRNLKKGLKIQEKVVMLIRGKQIKR
jgi:hypothetical protein